MKKIKWIMCIVLLVVLSACAAPRATITKQSSKARQQVANTTTGQVLKKVVTNKKLVIGTSADFPPFEWHQVKNGVDNIVGFDIAIAQAIADKLGVELDVIDMNFDSLIAALSTGKVDIVMAGMNPTPERQKEVAFSNIYYETGFSVLLRQDNAHQYQQFADLNGTTIGVQKGTEPETIVSEQLKNATATAMGKNDALVLALKSKKIDAVIIDKVVGQNFIKKNEGLVLSELAVPQKISGSAIAVPKGNDAFVALINAVIEELKQSGKMEELMVQYTEMMNE